MKGALEKKAMLEAGFTPDEVLSWEADERKSMLQAGFGQDEVDGYFGTKAYDPSPIRDYFRKAWQTVAGDENAPTVKDMLDAGFQGSVTGLAVRGRMPDAELPADAPMAQRIAYQAATLAGDLPAMAAGAIIGMGGGAVGGAGAGTATAPGPGTVGGAVGGAGIGAVAGAFALPAGLRAVMVDAYTKGDIDSFSRFWEALSSSVIAEAKGWVTGAATGGAGAVVGKVAAPLVLPAEIGTMVTVGKALEGEVPEPHDFLDAAVLIGGVKASVGIAGKLQRLYVEKGVRPIDVAEDIKRDPTIRQDLLSSNTDLPEAYGGTAPPPAAPAAGGGGTGVPPTVAPPPAAPAANAPGSPAAQAQQAILSRISVGEKDAARPFSWDALYQKTFDDLHPLKVVTDAMRGGKDVPASEDPYVLGRLTRGAAGRADAMLTFSGPFRYDDPATNVGRPLKSILEPVKDDLDGLRAYAVAKRAVELDSRSIDTGIPLTEARTVLAQGGAKYDGIVRELNDFQNNVLSYVRDSGMLSPEAFDAITKLNQDYVPFYRVMDDPAYIGGVGKGLKTRNPIKRIKGSDREIIDPIESVIKNTYLYTAMADRNSVGRALVELAEKSPEGGKYVEKVKTPVKPVDITPEEVQAFFKDHGVQVPAAVADEVMTVFRPGNLVPADDMITVFRDGKREVFKVDRPVAEAMKGLDTETVNTVIKILSAPAKLLRAGATLSPDFIARNPLRDQFSAFVFSDKGFQPLLDLMRGAASLVKKDEAFEEWLKSGGANATLVSLDRSYIQENLRTLTGEKGGGLGTAAWNVVKTPVHMLRVASELMENATRLGEFKRALGGASDKDSILAAGFEAREVTLDFARIGSKMKAVNMISAFFNAQLQGTDRAVRAFQDHPVGTMVKVAASITMPSVLLWAANHDDPRYKDIPQWQKDLFWLVMTKDHIYRIPKPFELGILFGSGPERMLDYIATKDPKAFQGFLSTAAGGVLPNFMPTAAIPLIEGATNHSFFTGGPVVPSYLEKELPEYRYAPYTTELTKSLGHALGTLPPLKHSDQISPLVIENYVRQWSGGLGMLMLQTADAGLRKAGVLPDAIQPASTLADIPVVKAFVVRHPSAQAQSIQDFHKEYLEARQVYVTVKNRLKEGDWEAAQREMALAPDAMARLDGVNEALSAQNRFIRMVWKNPGIQAEEKRQLIDTAYYQMIETARFGNDLAGQMKKTLKGTSVP